MMIRELEIREYFVAALPVGGAREGYQQFQPRLLAGFRDIWECLQGGL